MARQTQQLSEAIDDFIRHRRSTDLAKGTIKQDEHTLRRFLAVTGNVWVHAITGSHVTRFFEEAGKTRQSQTMRNDYTRLSMFFDWARHTKRMASDNDPLWGRRKPKAIIKERERVPVGKFPALLDAAGERTPRDRAVIALLLYTLARDGEITDLRIRDVDLDAGYIIMRIHKGHKEDRMPISSELDTELRRWLTIYGEDVGYLEPNYFLVPSRDTRPVFENGKIVGAGHLRFAPDRRISVLHPIVRPVLESIGFPIVDAHGRRKGEGAHTIRRSAARALFDALVEAGFDFALRIVQAMLHHASTKETERYLGLTADRFTRDELIKGKALYPALGAVTQLRGVDNGNADGQVG